MTLDGLTGRVALAAVAAAVIVVVIHLTTTVHALDVSRAANERWDPVGREIAAADSLNIDDGFAVAALQQVAPGATYAVVLPGPQAVADGRLSEITYDGVAPYLRYLLLPRLPVTPAAAQYVLCYACDRSFRGVRWIWRGDANSKLPGLMIGRRATS